MRNVIIERKPVKHARIHVLADGSVRVVAPPGFDVNSLIKEHLEWIRKKRAEIESIAKEVEGRENMLLLNGRFYHLVMDNTFEILPSGRLWDSTIPSTRRLKKNSRDTGFSLRGMKSGKG
ncbi:YgjP-like metallopeptidase domain-containing protein [Archaeoglobus sp.]|uniref:YgjP-like metallopeptidase domain-containing protein n=1 Tax=Archaeoglobus sp. TaxID=1872626 RepID=UPI0025BA5D91|nr:YgjP-like metallopeptidase domain-containing protein [Archaeoglobus sp.]